MFTLLTLTSALPLNQNFTNDNNANTAKSISQEKSNQITTNSKVEGISNPKTSYTYGESFSVSDVVDQIYYYVNVTGQNPSNWAGYEWYLPAQEVSVYIDKNPCATRSNGICVPETPSINNYKLQVASGSNSTGGTPNPSFPDQDATYGVYDSGGGIPLSTYYNYLKYDFQVQLPTQNQFSTLGISGTGTTTIYEYYPGNSTIGRVGWLINQTVISISSDNDVHVDPTNPSYIISASQNTSTIGFNTYIFDPSHPLNATQIDYMIYDSNNNPLCGTAPSANCSAYGFSVIENGQGSNKDLTDQSGAINFSVTFLNLGSITEGTYNFTITARLVDATSPGASTWNDTLYYLTKNKGAFSSVIVAYGFQTPSLTQSKVSSMTLFPIEKSSNLIRPGDYFEGNISQTVYSGTTPVVGAPVLVQLYDASSQANLTSKLYDGSYAKLSFLTSGGLNQSDGTGSIVFNMSLDLSIPLGTYNLVFIGDYANMIKQSPYWINVSQVQLLQNYTFTVSNLYDEAYFTFNNYYPSNSVSLSTSPTSITLEFLLQASLNNDYSNYASYYPSIPSNPYPLINVPVTATIYGGPIANVTIVSPIVYTDANGLVNFTLTTKYPDIFKYTTFRLNVTADYTLNILNNPLYRFTRDKLTQGNTSTLISGYVTFDPNYTIVDIKQIGTNVTSAGLRPGETGYYIYQAYNENNASQVFGNVPFSFSLEQGQTTAGIHINTLNPGNLSFPNGTIYIYFYSDYGITPESASLIAIRIKVILDITLFNSTYNPNNKFYMGTQPSSPVTYSDYVNTWSYINTSTFNLHANYLYAVPVFTTIPDKQVLDTATNLVRPNNETITIRLMIVFSSNGTRIQNFNFPVNISLVTAVKGVSLSIANGAQFLNFGNGYFLTNSTGYIDFHVTIYYDPSYNKSDTIQITATVDFGNDTCLSSCSGHPDRWIVGTNSVNPYNLSQQSFSNPITDLLIHKAPAYLTGSITANPANVNGTLITANPVIITPNTIVNLPFTVRVSNTGYASKDFSGTSPAIKGIIVYLNETVLKDIYNMTLLKNGLVTDVNGLVTFQVNITNATLDSPNNNFYQIPAYTDFENDGGASVSIANKTGTFNYYWLNGSISTIGYFNLTGQIHNYSSGNSSTIIVRRARTLSVSINQVLDSKGSVVSFDPLNIQILRGYQLQLGFSYKDSDGKSIPNANIKLTTQVIKLNTIGLNNITKTNFVITDSSGSATATLTTDSTYHVGKAGMVAEDQNSLSGTQFSYLMANFTIIAKLFFSQTPTLIMPKNSNEGFSGEQIRITGTISDDLGPINTNSYNLVVKDQITNSLRITGWDDSNNTIIGVNTTGTLSFNPTSVTFDFNWTIPLSYSNLEIYMPDSLNTIYFVKSNSTLYSPGNGLPDAFLNNIKVYQGIKYQFTISNTTAINVKTPNGTFNIANDYTGSLKITGTLTDNFNRSLSNRYVQLWNSSNLITVLTDGFGGFTYDKFISQSSQNGTIQLYIYYLSPYNQSQMNVLSASLTRQVVDSYSATIYFDKGGLDGQYVYQNTQFNFTVIDPTKLSNGSLVASTGVNKSSAVLYANGVPIWNSSTGNPWVGNSVFITWNVSQYKTVDNVTFVFFVLDNANNNASYSFIFKIDRIKPVIYNVTPATNDTYIYQSNYKFKFSATDAQSNIDTTSALMFFKSDFNSTYYTGINLSLTYNATEQAFESGSFNFYMLKSNQSVEFFVKDNAGNNFTTGIYVILADTIKPTIILINPTNNFDVTTQTVDFTFNVSDAQTDINLPAISLTNLHNNQVLSDNALTISNSGTYYTVDGHLTKNQLYLTDSNQMFLLNVTDNNGNLANFTLQFNIDIVGPEVTGRSVYQPNSTTLVNVNKNNLTASMQYVKFDLGDGGTPTTGVNISYIQIQLSINSSKIITLTIQNDVLTVSDPTFRNDFSFNFTNNQIVIGWDASNITNYGFEQTRKEQQLLIQWTVVGFYDNYGNPMTVNNLNTVVYRMDIEALPPPPNPLAELAGLAFIFLIFIAVGIGAAYIFEKIRYVG